MAQGKGGIIGPVNTVSAGKNKVTSTTSTGSSTITTQSGTKLIDALVVAGGGGGGYGLAGAGGAGGYRTFSNLSVCGGAPYAMSIGAGGAKGGACANGSQGTDSTLTIGCTTYTSEGGGYGAHAFNAGGAGGSGGGGGGANCGCARAGGAGNSPTTDTDYYLASPASDFEINDITVVFRAKRIK